MFEITDLWDVAQRTFSKIMAEQSEPIKKAWLMMNLIMIHKQHQTFCY